MQVPPQWAFVMQPVCATKTLRTHHHELLLRNLEDLSGHIAVLVHAEENGFIPIVDFYALTSAIELLERDPGRRLSVNISSLTVETLCDEFMSRIICESTVTARLTVELTETRKPDMAKTVLFRNLLEKRNIGFSIDDYGPGCSLGIDEIRLLRPDEVKLSAAALAAAMSGDTSWIERALTIGARVVAECIDTQEKLAFVREIGVGLVQGYIIHHSELTGAST